MFLLLETYHSEFNFRVLILLSLKLSSTQILLCCPGMPLETEIVDSGFIQKPIPPQIVPELLLETCHDWGIWIQKPFPPPAQIVPKLLLLKFCSWRLVTVGEWDSGFIQMPIPPPAQVVPKLLLETCHGWARKRWWWAGSARHLPPGIIAVN